MAGVLNWEVIPGVEESVLRGPASPDQYTCSLERTVGTREGADKRRCEGTKKLGDLTMRKRQTHLVSIIQERKQHWWRGDYKDDDFS